MCLVDTACIHPEVFQAVFLGLFATKLEFGIISFACARSVL